MLTVTIDDSSADRSLNEFAQTWTYRKSKTNATYAHQQIHIFNVEVGDLVRSKFWRKFRISSLQAWWLSDHHLEKGKSHPARLNFCFMQSKSRFTHFVIRLFFSSSSSSSSSHLLIFSSSPHLFSFSFFLFFFFTLNIPLASHPLRFWQLVSCFLEVDWDEIVKFSSLDFFLSFFPSLHPLMYIFIYMYTFNYLVIN